MARKQCDKGALWQGAIKARGQEDTIPERSSIIYIYTHVSLIRYTYHPNYKLIIDDNAYHRSYILIIDHIYLSSIMNTNLQSSILIIHHNIWHPSYALIIRHTHLSSFIALIMNHIHLSPIIYTYHRSYVMNIDRGRPSTIFYKKVNIIKKP